MTGKRLHRFALRLARQALIKAGTTNEDLWEVLSVKRAWLSGKATDSQLDEERAKAEESRKKALAPRWDAACAALWAADPDPELGAIMTLWWTRRMCYSDAEKRIRRWI